MCSPGIATALMIGGSAYSIASSYSQGKTQEKIANNNAVINERLAKDAEHKGGIAEQTHRQKVAQMKSGQKASIAASGVTMDSGSAQNLLADTAMMGELDAQTIRSNTAQEAWALRVGASNYKSQGMLDKKAGTQKAIGTLLTSSGQVADRWYPRTT